LYNIIKEKEMKNINDEKIPKEILREFNFKYLQEQLEEEFFALCTRKIVEKSSLSILNEVLNESLIELEKNTNMLKLALELSIKEQKMEHSSEELQLQIVEEAISKMKEDVFSRIKTAILNAFYNNKDNN